MNELPITTYAFLTIFGSSPFYPALIFVASFLHLWVRRRKKEAFLVVLSTLSFFYSGLIKSFFKFPRPQEVISLFYWENFSFPSSHVVFYTVFFGYLLYLTYKVKQADKVVRMVLAALCIFFIVLVGPARVALNVHWVIDVIAGYFFGVAYLAGLIGLDIVLSKYKRHDDESSNGRGKNKTRR